MVTFFELKKEIPDDISSLVHRSLPDAKRCPCKRGEMKVYFATLRNVRTEQHGVFLMSKEIADEFVERSTKTTNYQSATSLPIYLFARFA